MQDIPHEKSSGNVFLDMGYTPAEAAERTVKATLIMAIKDTVEARRLTQKHAAEICGTDQPTLSKILRGQLSAVTIEKLASWLTALGRTVEVRVLPYDPEKTTGAFVVAA